MMVIRSRFAVFFGCSLAGACFTLLLPEVKGRDPDVVDREEMRAAAASTARQRD